MKRLTPKMKAHTTMAELAQSMFGKSWRFVGWCIANTYDRVTLAQIKEETIKLQKEKDNG